MRFRELSLPGAYLIELDPHEDERGFFARVFSDSAFAERGLPSHFAEVSLSFNRLKGTVRGMHFQCAPHQECKLVRCVAGAVHDTVVDLRRDSPTYLKSESAVLSADNRTGLYIPKGMGHGFQTLRDSTELLYMIDVPHHRESARGVRWNDPAVRVVWPDVVSVISDRDLGFPNWTV